MPDSGCNRDQNVRINVFLNMACFGLITMTGGIVSAAMNMPNEMFRIPTVSNAVAYSRRTAMWRSCK
jgi:hypothetical protein